MIPKLIHLCWLSGDPYPHKIQKCLDSWKRKLPDYEVMLWDLNRFDINTVPWVAQAYARRKYAFAADYIRLYALYHYGGIYLDSDVEILKSFDVFLDLPYFVGAENAGTIEAAILGAEKGCDWVKHCLDYYADRNFIMENGEMDIRMLPEIMTETIQHIKPVINLTIEEVGNLRGKQLHEALFVLPSEFFSPKIFDSREILITPYTYAIHHYQNSWFSHKAFIYYRVRMVFIRLFGYAFIRKMEKIIFRR